MSRLFRYGLASLCVLALATGLLRAQTDTLKGRVIDEQSGTPLVGANIYLEKTSYGVASDSKGAYVIPNVPPGTYSLAVSYVGYEQFRQEVAIRAGETQTVDIRLRPSPVTLNPIVVTAIGTQEQRERLGVSVSSITGQRIANAGGHDIISNIAGLAPGINTTETTGDPGSATRIVLRGPRSLQNENQPLIVVDGVPVFMTTQYTGASTGGTAAISRAIDINPDDIKEMEVYKGPSAASLWGSRAANGVIAITTKTGRQTADRKLSISIRSRSYTDELLHPVTLQTRFGQGVGGQYSFNNSASWGDPIFLRPGGADSLTRPGYPYSKIAAKRSARTYDHSTELFRKPVTWDYGVDLNGGDEWGDFYLNVSRLSQEGIILSNSDLGRTSLRGSATRHFAENVTARVTASYVKTATDRIQQGSNISGLLLGAYRTPPDFNNEPYLVDYIAPDGTVTYGWQRTYRNGEGNPALSTGYDNPLFVINKVPTNASTDRLLGTGEVSYDAFKWFNVLYRVGADYYTDRGKTEYPFSDAAYKTGWLSRAVTSQYQVNSDLMGKATGGINDDLDGSLLVGFHLGHQQLDQTSVTASRFVLYDAPITFANALDYTPTESQTIIRTAALYGEFDVNVLKQVFFKLTGRGESASTYGPSVPQTYFYPAANVAWQFTKLPALKDNGIISFGKVRAAYGAAANQPGAYLTKTYFTYASPGNGWGEALYGSYYNGAFLRSDQRGNPELKPEVTKETEFGVDLRFFSDRLSLSATRYFNTTTDAVLGLSIAPSSGFASYVGNAAKIKNTGTELQLIADWLRVHPFSWTSTINFSHNRNEVTDMGGVQSVFLNGFTDPSSRAVLHQPLGVLYGTRWARKADGSFDLDPNAFPRTDANPGVLGDPNPKYRMGIINTLRYGKLALNVLIDVKAGGDVWNGTKGALYFFGTAGDQNWWTTVSASQAATLKNYSGQTLEQVRTRGSRSVVVNGDGSYSFRGYVRNFGGGDVIIDEAYFRSGPGSGFTGPAEQFIEDGSFVRLRDVTLSYTFPLEMLGVQNLTLSLTGRNLKTWTNYTGNDPETNLTGPSNGQGLDYFNNPTVRSWIVSLQLDY